MCTIPTTAAVAACVMGVISGEPIPALLGGIALGAIAASGGFDALGARRVIVRAAPQNARAPKPVPARVVPARSVAEGPAARRPHDDATLPKLHGTSAKVFDAMMHTPLGSAQPSSVVDGGRKNDFYADLVAKPREAPGLETLRSFS